MPASHHDVVIAGLGAMGSAAAYHLARRGVRVLGLDRFAPPHAHGSSHGESRIIRQAYFEHPAYVPLVRRAWELWDELAGEIGRPLLRRTGALMLGREEGEVIAGTLRSVAEHGLEHERLDTTELRRRFPVFRAADDVVGVYEERAGVLEPEACIAAHLRAARARGAELRYDEPVLGWAAAREEVEVHTPRGRHRAASLVLALGAWLPQLAPGLPLQVERQVMLWFRPAARPEAFRPGRLPVFLWETGPGEYHYGVPDLGTGVKVARHHGGEIGTIDSLDPEVRPSDIAPVRDFLARHVPDAAGEPLRGTVCRYTNTPSGHFLIDRHPEHPRIWVVSPCSGHGFKFASVIGEAVAELVATGDSGHELGLFRM